MPTGNGVVDRAIEAHGGERRWQQVTALQTTWTFRGMMFKLRLREASLRRRSARISTREPRVEIGPFPVAGSSGVFASAGVEIRPPSGPPASLANARDSFRSVRSLLWWNAFEMLYFAGYVLWNYIQLPFLLLWPGLTFTSGGTTQQAGETWDKVIVDFPPEIPTHSPRQTFYFGPDGLLRRHDYVAIMSRLARGARYIHRYQEVDGLKLAQRIEMRLGTWGEHYVPLMSLGFVDLDDVGLQ